MPILYVLVGLPACGKTTYRDQIVTINKLIIISSDDYIDQKAAELNKTYTEVFTQFASDANKHCFKIASENSNSNNDVVWDQTNLTVKSRSVKLKLFPNHKKIAVVFPIPEMTEWRKRLQSRPGKTIPDDVLNSMKHQFEYPSLDEGFDELKEIV